MAEILPAPKRNDAPPDVKPVGPAPAPTEGAREKPPLGPAPKAEILVKPGENYDAATERAATEYEAVGTGKVQKPLALLASLPPTLQKAVEAEWKPPT